MSTEPHGDLPCTPNELRDKADRLLEESKICRLKAGAMDLEARLGPPRHPDLKNEMSMRFLLFIGEEAGLESFCGGFATAEDVMSCVEEGDDVQVYDSLENRIAEWVEGAAPRNPCYQKPHRKEKKDR